MSKTLTAETILRICRERAISSRKVGEWNNGTIVVTADRRDGFWQYDVGTYAKQHAYGKTGAVVEALRSLLAAG